MRNGMTPHLDFDLTLLKSTTTSNAASFNVEELNFVKTEKLNPPP